MNADRDRDRLLDDTLTRELRPPEMTPATEFCLDAETIAAWMDGGLDASSLAMAEAHASSCRRCQALLGTVAITAPAAPVNETHGARLWRWWLAPVAATAAAVTLWMVVPPQPAAVSVSAPPREEGFAEPEAAMPTSRPEAAAEDGKAEARANKRDAPALAAMERKAEAPKLADSAAEGRLAAAAPPESPTPTASAMRQQADPLADAQVTARSSPSPDVIWSVGRAGIVMLATDGRTFLLVPFPETVDLTAVTATDDRHAIVTTVDGRTFQTADGGRTWQRP